MARGGEWGVSKEDNESDKQGHYIPLECFRQAMRVAFNLKNLDRLVRRARSQPSAIVVENRIVLRIGCGFSCVSCGGPWAGGRGEGLGRDWGGTGETYDHVIVTRV